MRGPLTHRTGGRESITGEARSGCCRHQLAIRERFPATVRGGVAGHTEFPQRLDQVNVHVSVKQPHGKRR